MKTTSSNSHSSNNHAVTHRKKGNLTKLKKGLIKDIVRMEVKIHRITLNARRDTLYNLQPFFGNLAITKSNHSGQFKGYNKIAYKSRKKGKIIISSWPIKGYLPQSRIYIPNPSQKLLCKLSDKFPCLTVSEVEYAVDIFYSSPKYVRRYFRLLRRYVYFRYKRIIKFYTHHKKPRKSQINMTLDAKPIKIYERGNDEDKVHYKGDGGKKGWFFDKLKKVRIEVTADNKILRKHDLVSLDEFIQSVKFENVFMEHLHFKRFKSSAKKLPKEYSRYKSKYISGYRGSRHPGTFYAEFNKAKTFYKNIAQFITNVAAFEKLKDKLRYEIRKFEKAWSKRYMKYKEQI